MTGTAPTERDVSICPHCGERHARILYRDLHVGHTHRDAMSVEEQQAFAAAVEAEEAWFVRLRKHVRSGFGVLPVFLLYVLTWVLLSEMEANAGFAIMLLPGFVAFSVLVYGITFSYLSKKEQDAAEAEAAAKDTE